MGWYMESDGGSLVVPFTACRGTGPMQTHRLHTLQFVLFTTLLRSTASLPKGGLRENLQYLKAEIVRIQPLDWVGLVNVNRAWGKTGGWFLMGSGL